MDSSQPVNSSPDGHQPSSESARIQDEVIESMTKAAILMKQVSSNVHAGLEATMKEMKNHQETMTAVTHQNKAAEQRLARIEESHKSIKDEVSRFVEDETKLAKERDQQIRWLASENRVMSGRLREAERLIFESVKEKSSDDRHG